MDDLSGTRYISVARFSVCPQQHSTESLESVLIPPAICNCRVQRRTEQLPACCPALMGFGVMLMS